MRNLQERAVEATARFAERKGYEVIDSDWRGEGGSSVDLVAMDEDTLVFIEVSAHVGSEREMPSGPSEGSRGRREVAAAKWLSEHIADDWFVNRPIRFDAVDMMVLGDSGALLRHHINCYGSPLAELSAE